MKNHRWVSVQCSNMILESHQQECGYGGRGSIQILLFVYNFLISTADIIIYCCLFALSPFKNSTIEQLIGNKHTPTPHTHHCITIGCGWIRKWKGYTQRTNYCKDGTCIRRKVASTGKEGWREEGCGCGCYQGWAGEGWTTQEEVNNELNTNNIEGGLGTIAVAGSFGGIAGILLTDEKKGVVGDSQIMHHDIKRNLTKRSWENESPQRSITHMTIDSSVELLIVNLDWGGG